MRLRCGFQPLWDRLVYIRHMSFVRPAVSYPMDPTWVRNALYFGLNSSQQVVATTDQNLAVVPSIDGKFALIIVAV